MKITVFTPTYNRADLIGNLYKSLCQQTFKDFEWLVVDDGSNDNTEVVINRYISEGNLPINYIKQPNGGKHRAVNRGLKEAKGELFFVVDSDDLLPADALEYIDVHYAEVRDDPTIAGICGMKAHFDGNIVGVEYPFDTLDISSIDFVYKYNHRGDKAEVIRTEIFRQFPFPDYQGEKYCPESLVWNRIARHYKLHFFKKTIYLCEYLPDGLSHAFVKNKRKSPTYATQICSEILSMNVPLTVKIKNAVTYWRYAPCRSRKEPRFSIPLWSYLLAPIGYAIYLHDNRIFKVSIK